MGVRVRLLLAGTGSRTLDAVALLSGGFETEAPAVLLPQAAAERLFGPGRGPANSLATGPFRL